jgi:hypothetical protein
MELFELTQVDDIDQAIGPALDGAAEARFIAGRNA